MAVSHAIGRSMKEYGEYTRICSSRREKRTFWRNNDFQWHVICLQYLSIIYVVLYTYTIMWSTWISVSILPVCFYFLSFFILLFQSTLHIPLPNVFNKCIFPIFGIRRTFMVRQKTWQGNIYKRIRMKAECVWHNLIGLVYYCRRC